MSEQGRLIYLMGPSGSGKDSLLEAARPVFDTLRCKVMRRVITRSAESVGEEAVSVTVEEFNALEGQGAFAMSWRANGLAYGIPIIMDEWLAMGWSVVVNGSRGYLPEAFDRYAGLIAVVLSVDAEALKERLLRRNRENLQQIESRLARNSQYEGLLGVLAPDQVILRLDNSGSLATTVAGLNELLAGVGLTNQQEHS